MKPTIASLSFILCLILSTMPAMAQPLATGVRAGASGDPDQFYFGGHVETGALVDRVHFRPNVELGVGDDATLIAFNFDLVYKFPSRNVWNVYGFGGPALNVASAHDDTDAGGGFNIGLGIETRKGLFGEFKVGMIDSPDFKIGIGWRF
jgi:hypothetical protein